MMSLKNWDFFNFATRCEKSQAPTLKLLPVSGFVPGVRPQVWQALRCAPCPAPAPLPRQAPPSPSLIKTGGFEVSMQ